MDRHTEIQDLVQLFQKGAFSPIGLDQMDVAHPECCQHRTGKPCPASEIHHALRHWKKREELRGVQEVAMPQIRQGREPDQVHTRAPFQQQRFVAAQPIQRFT